MIANVPLPEAYRLLNHGPVTLVTAAHAGRRNVMAASWAMPLDFDPPKVAVVVDGTTLTRELVEAAGEFALNIPCRAQAGLTVSVGSCSGRDGDKFVRYGIATRDAHRIGAPLVEGCVAWLECRVIRYPEIALRHDLFLAEVVAAEADSDCYLDGRWLDAPAARRTLHYVAGGRFFVTGEAIDVAADR